MPKRATPAPPSIAAEPESLDQLRGDCARMAPHWRNAVRRSPAPPVALSRIRGVTVPSKSAHLLDGMSEYGD
ncbi:hypothetical protein [Streptomyces sp. SAJ15]|uniref:hypothetical protein n=1 Tax=Streptomyces sp. SAJ15 TaxID=2011095 RepID=UPI0011871C1E|nr:hypothetical protein [Streptomyces sp. SAJ15]TVL90948.1 hypothetical protein CD790_20550 [Streptomyces sp. SAJ15]